MQTINDLKNAMLAPDPGALPNNCVVSTLVDGDTNYMLTLKTYFPKTGIATFGIYGANATLVVEINNAGKKEYPLTGGTASYAINIPVPANTTSFYAHLKNVTLAVKGVPGTLATSF